MSRISDLVAELCPEGVERVPLGELVVIKNGRDYKHLSTGDVPVYGSGGVMAHVDTPAHPGPSVLIPRKGSLNNLFYVEKPFWTVDTIFYTEIGDRIDGKYLYYFLQKSKLGKMNHAGGVPSQTQSALKKIAVPLPPIDVQREIVHVLDQFIALEAELQAELEARKRQRLTLARTLPNAPYSQAPCTDTPELVKLGEVAVQHVAPVRVQSDKTYTNLGVKWYGEGVFAREAKAGSAIKAKTLYQVKSRHFIYNRMFVTEGSFAVVTPELADGVVSNEFPVYGLDTSRVLPEWLLLYFKDEFTLKRIEGEVTGTERGSTKSRRRWKENQFEAFEIELPTISAQQELVRVIGTASDLEATLIEELTARRTQYEYYRDRLLTFDEATA